MIEQVHTNAGQGGFGISDGAMRRLRLAFEATPGKDQVHCSMRRTGRSTCQWHRGEAATSQA